MKKVLMKLGVTAIFALGLNFTTQSANAAPIAAFQFLPSLPVIGELVQFDGSLSYESDPNRILVQYDWDFESDGQYDFTGINATFAYTQAATYFANLRVTNDIGEVDFSSLQIIVAAEGGGEPPAVPLPAPILLLLGGLGLFAWVGARKKRQLLPT